VACHSSGQQYGFIGADGHIYVVPEITNAAPTVSASVDATVVAVYATPAADAAVLEGKRAPMMPQDTGYIPANMLVNPLELGATTERRVESADTKLSDVGGGGGVGGGELEQPLSDSAAAGSPLASHHQPPEYSQATAGGSRLVDDDGAQPYYSIAMEGGRSSITERGFFFFFFFCNDVVNGTWIPLSMYGIGFVWCHILIERCLRTYIRVGGAAVRGALAS
jgi:hypothetical protein